LKDKVAKNKYNLKLAMAYTYKEVAEAADYLKEIFEKSEDKRSVLRDPAFRNLYSRIKDMPADQKAAYGAEVNSLKDEVDSWLENLNSDEKLSPIDVTAPFDTNTALSKRPCLLSSQQGTIHPLTRGLKIILDIFSRMGFEVVESREIDDDYHMFASLNFPEGHPARDDFDTFMTVDGLIAPAHTSTMQNRVMKSQLKNLENGEAISVVIPGRTFRNEDVDARHDHTFHQVEGVYVDKGINAGNLMATFKTFLEDYYGKSIDVKSQPFYFPFTEPSFELLLGCPFCDKHGCHICSNKGWIELMGMGMIHPNVLKEAGVDQNVYTGFAWGFGLERLVMMKYGIENVRHFESGKLEFLRQF